MEREQTNLWLKVGNKCLQCALFILENENHPDIETTEVVKKLVETAISIDMLNLQWEGQNQSGEGAFQGLASLQKSTKKGKNYESTTNFQQQ